jgi:hypothetical protein
LKKIECVVIILIGKITKFVYERMEADMTRRSPFWYTVLTSIFLLIPVLVATAGDKGHGGPPIEAPAPPCSLTTLKGSFGFHGNATVMDSTGLQIFSTGLINFDGEGNLSGESTNSLNGWMNNSSTFTGIYTVNPDCTYSGQQTDETGTTLHFDGAISGSGMLQGSHFVLTDPGVVGSGSNNRISPGGCSLSTLKGSYALSGQGAVTAFTPPALIAHTGIVTYDGKGNFVGHDTVTMNGTASLDTFAGTYDISPNCTVTIELISSGFGTIHELGRITGEGKSQEVHFIYTDFGLFATDTIRKQ